MVNKWPASIMCSRYSPAGPGLRRQQAAVRRRQAAVSLCIQEEVLQPPLWKSVELGLFY